MSFQDEYKITNADRLDKGVYGLPDTPGMTTAAIQERFDSLGNLAIDKFNALVEAASDVIDGSDTKFPTNKAVEDYISGEGGAIIDDTTPSLHKAYSSEKVENMFGDVASRVIDDNEPSSDKTYSSAEIEEKLSNIPSPGSIIDDDTASTAKTYSSSKLESDFISVSDTEEQTATDEFTTINGGILSSLKVSLSPVQNKHGYSEPWVGGAGKNKFVPRSIVNVKSVNTAGVWDGNSYTYNGVVYTLNGDDDDNLISIKVNGTASGSSRLNLITANLPLLQPYSGMVLNGSVSPVRLVIQRASSPYNLYALDSGDGSLIQNIEYPSQIFVEVLNGNTASNAMIYPMIRLATESDPTFEPYSNICPISGHTQVDVWNHQKNLFDPTNVINGYIGSVGDVFKVVSLADARTIFAPCEPNTTYTISKTAGKRFSVGWSDTLPDIGVTVNDGVYDATASVITFTTGATAKYIVAFVWLGTQDTITADEMLASCQIELGSTATAYVPYNGYQVIVNLGGTYYSGTLDVVTGVFTPDTAKQTYPWGTYTRTDDLGNTRRRILATLSDALGTDSSDIGANISDSVDEQTGWTSDTPHFYIDSSNKTFVVFLPIDTPDSTNIEVCYKLANPTPIQLSPTTIKALVGENHLSAPLEGQEITESVYSPLAKWNAVIDDTTASDDTTYSSNKINSIVPQIDDSAASATKVFSSLKTAALITELSERFDFSTTEKPIGWWTDGKVYYGKIINAMGCPKEMFGLMVDLGVEVDTFIGIFAVGDAQDDNYNGGYCMGGTIYCKVTKSEGQNTQIQPACAVMALSRVSLLVLYTKVED